MSLRSVTVLPGFHHFPLLLVTSKDSLITNIWMDAFPSSSDSTCGHRHVQTANAIPVRWWRMLSQHLSVSHAAQSLYCQYISEKELAVSTDKTMILLTHHKHRFGWRRPTTIFLLWKCHSEEELVEIFSSHCNLQDRLKVASGSSSLSKLFGRVFQKRNLFIKQLSLSLYLCTAQKPGHHTGIIWRDWRHFTSASYCLFPDSREETKLNTLAFSIRPSPPPSKLCWSQDNSTVKDTTREMPVHRLPRDLLYEKLKDGQCCNGKEQKSFKDNLEWNLSVQYSAAQVKTLSCRSLSKAHHYFSGCHILWGSKTEARNAKRVAGLSNYIPSTEKTNPVSHVERSVLPILANAVSKNHIESGMNNMRIVSGKRHRRSLQTTINKHVSLRERLV